MIHYIMINPNNPTTISLQEFENANMLLLLIYNYLYEHSFIVFMSF